MFGPNPRTVVVQVIAEVLLRDMVKSDVPHTPEDFARELWNYVDAVDAEAKRRTDEERAKAPVMPAVDDCSCPACTIRRAAEPTPPSEVN